jgi:hypothetical protein
MTARRLLTIYLPFQVTHAAFALLLLASLVPVPAWSQGSYSIIIGVDQVDGKRYAENKRAHYELTRALTDDMRKTESVASVSGHRIISLKNAAATRKHILDTLQSVGKGAARQERVFIYLLGYGDSVTDKKHDEQTGFDQAFLTYDDLLTDDDLFDVLRQFYSDKLIVLFTDLIHLKYTDKESEQFMLDFTGRNEGIASGQHIDSHGQFSPGEIVDEKYNLIYFGVTQSTTSTRQLANELYSIRRSAKLRNKLRATTFRKVAEDVNIEFRKDRVFFYREIGKTIGSYEQASPFKQTL